MWRRIGLLLLPLWTGCAAPGVVRLADEQAPWLARIVADLSAPEMEGRAPGTRGLDRAADYLVARFESAGLVPPVAEHSHFTQAFSIPLDVLVHQRELALNQRALQPGVDFQPAGVSGSGRFEGPAVFVGYGIADDARGYDSFRHAHPDALRDKVAVALAFEPQDDSGTSLWARDDPGTLGPWTEASSLLRKARAAADRGAVALLVATPPRQQALSLASPRAGEATELAPIPVIRFSTEALSSLLKAAGRNDPRIPAHLQAMADRDLTRVEAFDNLTIRGVVEMDRPLATVRNIVGLLPGRGSLSEQVVVLGAHYDHLGSNPRLHPGADDNASGVAGLLLLAQRMVLKSGLTTDERRTLLFVAFTAEERGLLGSDHLLKNLDDLGLHRDRIVAMVNLDMIGRLRDDRLFVFGTETGDRLAHVVRAAAALSGLRLSHRGAPPGASDHVNFQLRDIPAVHFFTGTHSDYHQPTDTADKIDVLGIARVVEVVEPLAWALCTDPRPMVFVPERADRPSVVPTAFLGVLPAHDTLDGSAGCAIAGTVPGSPADHAGLCRGDVIVRWSAQPLPNGRALTRVLAQSSPGDRVTLTIERDGVIFDVDVVLGRR